MVFEWTFTVVCIFRFFIYIPDSRDQIIKDKTKVERFPADKIFSPLFRTTTKLTASCEN